MTKVIAGQVLLVICCVFYLIWWYRGFRPGVNVSRIGGTNGVLLLVTAAFGIAGLVMSLTPVPEDLPRKVSSGYIIVGGVIAYLGLLLLTRYVFHRIVTTELFLIVGWTMLEIVVITKLNAAGGLSDGRFCFMCCVFAIAFVISMVLYVAYYRMEEMKAFYAAMVPLVTEAVSMIVLIITVMAGKG